MAEMVYAASTVECSHLIVHESMAEKGAELAKLAGIAETDIIRLGDEEHASTQSDNASYTFAPLDETRNAFMLYTSGTTGGVAPSPCSLALTYRRETQGRRHHAQEPAIPGRIAV
jgi:acyl-coenzyme A synthetase/AMP-(fatty) acid ligase